MMCQQHQFVSSNYSCPSRAVQKLVAHCHVQLAGTYVEILKKPVTTWTVTWRYPSIYVEILKKPVTTWTVTWTYPSIYVEILKKHVTTWTVTWTYPSIYVEILKKPVTTWTVTWTYPSIYVEILKKPVTTSGTVAVSGGNSNTWPPYEEWALTVTDVEQQKLRIRKIRGRRRTRGTECKRKERCYVKR